MDKLSLPCDCVGTCGIALVTEFEEYETNDGKIDPQEFFVEFYTHVGNRNMRTWHDRLSTAWKVFRGKEHWLHSYCWTGPEQPAKLRDFLNEKLKEYDKPNT